MPTKMTQSSVPASTMKSSQIINTVRAQGANTVSGINFADRLPECAVNNLSSIGEIIVSDYDFANAFLRELFNRIGLVTMNYRRYTNPLKLFKQGKLDYGESVEELAFGLVKAKCDYRVEDGVNDVFSITKEEVGSAIHKINLQVKYPLSITRPELRKAFTSEYSLGSFIEGQMTGLYNSYELDEFIIYKNLMHTAIMDGFAKVMPVVAVTDEASGKSFSVAVKALATKLRFMSTLYNKRGFPQFTPEQDLIIVVDANLDATLSVQVLAYAFNMSEAEFLKSGIKVVIDEFPIEGLHGFVCDKRFFQIYDVDFEMTNMFNGSNRVWNYWLHVWEIISASPFMQAVALVDSSITPTVDSVTVSPTAITTKAGQVVQFNAVVEGDGLANESVNWTVTGSTPSEGGIASTISGSGLLTISNDETATTLTVKATSVQTPEISGTAEVTLG